MFPRNVSEEVRGRTGSMCDVIVLFITPRKEIIKKEQIHGFTRNKNF